MGTSSVDMDVFLTSLTNSLFFAALVITVEFHILTKEAQTTTESAWLNDPITLGNMVYSFLVAVNTLAGLVRALKLHLLEVLLHSSMHFSPLDFVIAKAFLWAALIFLSPWSDTRGAENRLAPAAFQGVFNHICADWAAKVVGSLLLRPIYAH